MVLLVATAACSTDHHDAALSAGADSARRSPATAPPKTVAPATTARAADPRAGAPASRVEVSAGSVEASLAPGAPVQSAVLARRAAEETATSMLQAWARNDTTPRIWWRRLGPLLSAQGRQDYAHTDPARIPDVAVSGPARVVEQAHSMWARATVPTTHGMFTVELTRPTPTASWLVDRLDFPTTSMTKGSGRVR